MMLPAAYQQLVSAIDELPSVGPRAAARLAQHLLISGQWRLLRDALEQASGILLCRHCRLYSAEEICTVCADPARNNKMLLVVAGMDDAVQAEQVGWRGHYYVLHGLLSPMTGIGPAQLGLPALAERAADPDLREIIVALDDSAEGRATSAFIRQLLQPATAVLTELSWQRWYEQESAR